MSNTDAKRETQVQCVLNVMGHELEVLSKHVTCLEDKIRSILSPIPPSGKNESPQPKHSVELAIFLDSRVSEIKSISERVSDMIGRIEI